MTPFEGEGVWLRCALHAHTTNSDGEMSPDMLVRHYEWAGYDVLAITDHWVRTVEPSTRKLLVIPSTELNAVVADGHDSHVLALGVEADPGAAGRVRAARRRRGLDPGKSRRSVPRAHVLERTPNLRVVSRARASSGIEVWNTGCELEIGRGDSSVHWDEALEHGRRALRARDRRLAPPRLRQRLRVDDGARGGALAGGGARRIACGRFYGSTGPEIHHVEVTRRRGRRALLARAERDTRLGRHRGARANAGRLGYPNASTILERDAAG